MVEFGNGAGVVAVGLPSPGVGAAVWRLIRGVVLVVCCVFMCVVGVCEEFCDSSTPSSGGVTSVAGVMDVGCFVRAVTLAAAHILLVFLVLMFGVWCVVVWGACVPLTCITGRVTRLLMTHITDDFLKFA